MFSEEIINIVWNKAKTVEGYDPIAVRKDCCGAWIIRHLYGDRDSEFGWEIDHVYPEALGGRDDIENLRAMHWKNNASKGDDFPVYKAKVHAVNNKNTEEEMQYTVNDDLQKVLRNLYHFE